MITLGLLSVCLVLLLGAVLLVLAWRWSLEVAFVRVCWIPAAALLLQLLFFQSLLRSLSYAAIAPPLLTAAASLALTLVGATLALSARQRREPHTTLVYATLVASIPAVFLAGYILYGFVASVTRDG